MRESTKTTSYATPLRALTGHDRGHAKSVVTRVRLAHPVPAGRRRRDQRPHGVEPRTHRFADAPVPSPLAHDAPDVPGEHLALVERREVADHITGDEPGATEAIAR